MDTSEKFECSICKNRIIGKVGSIINLGEGQLIVKCKKCTSKTMFLSNQPEVMVVPVTKSTLNFIIKNKKYYHPMNYWRKGGHYLAFYVKNPVSAITHYAKVKYVLKDVPVSDLMDVSQIKLRNAQEALYKLYELEFVKELDTPIKRGSKGAIQNIQNTTLEKLRKAKQIRDI